MESSDRVPVETPDRASKLGTVRVFIRNESRGGCASPAGKLVSTSDGIQVVTPNSRGPWGDGGETLALQEWNRRFRNEDPFTPNNRMSAVRDRAEPIRNRVEQEPNRSPSPY